MRQTRRNNHIESPLLVDYPMAASFALIGGCQTVQYFDFQEILALKPDGSWTFEIPNGMGFHIMDEFRTEAIPTGTKLTIHSIITPLDSSAASRISVQKRSL